MLQPTILDGFDNNEPHLNPDVKTSPSALQASPWLIKKLAEFADISFFFS